MFNSKTWHVGEELATKFLKQKKYKIVARNEKLAGAEVDIIAIFPAKQEIAEYKLMCKAGKLNKMACDNLIKQAQDTLVFVEVKARTSKEFGGPENAVNKTKMMHIKKFAQSYVRQKNLTDVQIRFDVVSVVIFDNNNFEIEHFENAF